MLKKIEITRPYQLKKHKIKPTNRFKLLMKRSLIG